MPRLRAAIALAANPGDRRSARAAWRRSRMASSTHTMPRTSRISSETRSIPPNASTAARRASAGFIPARMFLSVSMSRWNASSADIRRSATSRRISARARRSQARTRSVGSGRLATLGTLEDQIHCAHVLPPALRLRNEGAAPRGRERVEPGRPVLLGGSPFALDPRLLLEPLQRRIERALSHPEQVLGLLLNELAQGPPVHGPSGERSQDEEIECAAEEIGFLSGHGVPNLELSSSDTKLGPCCRKSTIPGRGVRRSVVWRQDREPRRNLSGSVIHRSAYHSSINRSDAHSIVTSISTAISAVATMINPIRFRRSRHSDSADRTRCASLTREWSPVNAPSAARRRRRGSGSTRMRAAWIDAPANFESGVTGTGTQTGNRKWTGQPPGTSTSQLDSVRTARASASGLRVSWTAVASARYLSLI